MLGHFQRVAMAMLAIPVIVILLDTIVMVGAQAFSIGEVLLITMEIMVRLDHLEAAQATAAVGLVLESNT